MNREPSRRRRAAKIAGLALASLIGMVAVGLVAAATLLQGERLARIIKTYLPPLGGRIELRSVSWPPLALVRGLFTDEPVFLHLEGVAVYDPDGTLVLGAPTLDVGIPLRTAMKGKVRLHGIVLGPGSSWRFAATKDGKATGFLVALAPKDTGEPKLPPSPIDPKTPAQPFVLELVDAKLDGFTATFDFPGAWGLELRDSTGRASLELILGDAVTIFYDVTNLHARKGGYLRILENEVLPFDDVVVPRVGTTREWPNHIFLDVGAGKTGQSTLVGKGFFTNIYDDTQGPVGIDMHAEIHDAADALAAVASGHAIPGLVVSGESAHVALDLEDGFDRLRIDGTLAGLDVAFQDKRALGLGMGFGFVVAPMKLTVRDFGFAAPGGGRFGLDATLVGDDAQAKLRFERLTTNSYVPAPLRRTLAGKLDGRIEVKANLGKKSVAAAIPGLTLARAGAGGLPRTITVRGRASATPEAVHTDGVEVIIPGATARVSGDVSLARQLLSLALKVTASDLPKTLGTFGLPPVAQKASFEARATGSFDNPSVTARAAFATLAFGGRPLIDDVTAQLSLENGRARLESLDASGAAGTFHAAGEAELWRGSVEHMLRTPVIGFELGGEGVDLETLIGSAMVRGQLAFDAEAHGPVDRLSGRLTLPPGAGLLVLGERWDLEGLDVEVSPDTVTLRSARLVRSAGGEVSLEGSLPMKGRHKGELVLAVHVRDVPLEGLPGLAETGGLVTGLVSLDLNASGSLAHPKVSGNVRLADVVARGAALGDGRIDIEPTADGVAVTGRLFDRFDLAATAVLAPAGPRLRAELAFQRLRLEDLVPELATTANGQGIASGRVTVAIDPSHPLAVDVTLSELALAIDHPAEEAAAGAPATPISIRNEGPIHASLVGDRIRLDPTKLRTDGGELLIAAELAGDDVNARARGHLDLELLHAFTFGALERLTGDVRVELAVAGKLPRPSINGTIAIAHPVRVRPRNVDLELGVPSGVIRLAGDRVAVEDLVLAIDDGRLKVRGEAELGPAFAPTSVSATLSGDVPAKLLTVVAPGAIVEASGRVRLSGSIKGTPSDVDANARIDVGGVTMRLRDFSGELAFRSGTLALSPKGLTITNLEATVDDQGVLRVGKGTAPAGEIRLAQLLPTPKLAYVRVPIRGERLRYRIPNLIELDDLGAELDFAGNFEDGFELSGDVRVVSGRYVQDFAVRDLAISPRIQERSLRSPFEGKPWLENLALNFRVRTFGDTFLVQNNLAPELHMVVELQVGGVLSRPTLDGMIRPTDGRFRILGLRGDFDLVPNVNYVTFVPTKSLEQGETPEINLEAQSLVTDSAGIDHNVRMRIRGPIGQAAIDLSSDRGLDRNQTMVLLLSGRGATDLSQLNTAANPTVGANVSQGQAFLGQISRDTVSNLVEPYIDDVLDVLTARKLNLRPTIGADGFELRLVARPSRQFRLQLTYLRGFQGQTRVRGESSLWLGDFFSLRGFGEQFTLQQQQLIFVDQRINSVNLELTLDWPIRLVLP